ncbi:MAG TPA: acyl carrier protein [Cyanobacteria bacterium UBA8553]|nr:acyl carrier protein [Cyanobacteria bacterium UBA8553]HAJ60659.1 acyl carrier protein [Cyanobacteria bacterium UBA8543]
MPLTVNQVQSDIIGILKDITQEWELDFNDINPGTHLVADLGFSSIDIIQLVVALEEHFKQKLGFNELLMNDGQYIDDLSIEELVSFVSRKLQGN